MADFIKDTLTKVPGVDPRPVQRSQFLSGLNDGPAGTASRIAGLVSEEHAQDNSPYHTSNFGQLLPDSGHPLKTVVYHTKVTLYSWRNSRLLIDQRSKRGSYIQLAGVRLDTLQSPEMSRT
jgi:hypothetical protein